MKEHLRQLLGDVEGDLARTCLAREYLQARILQSLQDAGTFLHWAFLGGTALRFLYSLPRFSEDLDFSLQAKGGDPGVEPAAARVRQAMEREGYRVAVKCRTARTVASAWIRFPGLPYELGLSGQSEQTLAIRIEVDTNPPKGAGIQTTLVRRHVTLHLCHHDRPSLLAGKLHAVLARPWTKGRDLYDLAWYLADHTWPPPNLALLNASLEQTGWRGPAMTEANWRDQVRQRLAAVDWEQARPDVRPFLERERDVDLVAHDVLADLLA